MASDSDVKLGEEPEYEEKLDEAPKSILLGMMRQLKSGMDLSRVTLPTFILEPRSFLEKCSDFMAHGSIILDLAKISDPHQRFLCVCKWYLAGWYNKPPGVKKPYNPILGEVFRCRWEHGDKGTTHYVAEQVSHHPPISAFHFVNRKAGWSLHAVIRPKSKFLGNSAASLMEGEGILVLHELGEEYHITFPSYYVRGLLLGTMRMEMAGDVKITCQKTGLEMNGTYKNKGYFSGENNSIEAKIAPIGTKDTIYKINGRWDRELTLEEKKTKSTRVLLDIAAEKSQSFHPLTIDQDSNQQVYESRRVWQHVSKAIRANNHDAAAVQKSKLEDGQRAGKKEREERGEEWVPRLFENPEGHTDHSSIKWRFKFQRSAPFQQGDVDEEAFDQEIRNLHQTHPGQLAVGRELAAELASQ
uniref:Oxysterol-binding protein n=1 Tax=Hemiselmis andersenii TaxID=464988 RepID=A0A6T8P3H6_HEMAN|mmetsp:Transcript_57727/g.139372  ORF Transcript_57727/g.139372 Transcript_57727/m.139372 type:complete len:414 (+) Transcript_57727:227-1468(+)